MNSRSEYNRCQIARISTKSEKETMKEVEKENELEERLKKEMKEIRRKKREKKISDRNEKNDRGNEKKKKKLEIETESERENEKPESEYTPLVAGGTVPLQVLEEENLSSVVKRMERLETPPPPRSLGVKCPPRSWKMEIIV